MRKLRSLFLLWLSLAIITLVSLPASAPAEAAYALYPSSAFLQPIPAGVNYVLEPRISTFRQGSEEYAAPVYRVAAGTSLPIVIVTNIYGRVENWPIPTGAQPATGSDGHMVVVNYDSGFVYEFFQAHWSSGSTIEAGGMVAYPISANGISNPTNHRVTASGVANTNGMVMREDFDNGGGFDPNLPILHALSIHLPASMIAPGGFVSPAVGGESAGSDRTENRVPMGARFAVPAWVDVDSLAVHPFTKAILRAARDYGMFVTDASGAGNYNGGNIGRIEIEPGMIQAVFGVNGDALMAQVEYEVGTFVQQYGVHRIDGLGPGGPLTTPTCPEMEDPSFTAAQGLYCVVLMRNGAWVNTIGSIPDELVEAGVILAVEVVYYDAPGHTVNDFLNSDYEYVCIAGRGRYIYLDGRNTPRHIFEMDSTHDHGYTCAWIPAPGTVVLIEFDDD
jgi:hypothetical protein